MLDFVTPTRSLLCNLALNGEELTLYGRVVGNDYYTATGVVYGYSEANALGIKYSVTDFAVDWQTYRSIGENVTDTLTWQRYALQSNDTFLGSQGSDLMLGFAGNDILAGGGAISAPSDAGDTLLGNAGSDLLYGNGGDDILLGGSDLFDLTDSGDTLYGGMGNDTIYGAGGSDYIEGNAGNDLIALTSGNDTASGGTGNDIFVFFRSTTGYHTLLDFQQGDILSIEGGNITNILATALTDANGTFLRLSADSGITLAGVALASLDAGDFYSWG